MDFITGNKYKKICHYSLDNFGFIKHSEPEKNEILKIFVKVDYIHTFFKTKIERPYWLITHNGDIPIGDDYLPYMSDNNLIKWFGQNIDTKHFKLNSIPIGIANETWEHGNESILTEIINKKLTKENLIYANFDINTNKSEREICLSEINKNGVTLDNKKPFKEYLEEVGKSYFVISPNGNGIDCHKTWESLYLKSIPIVTKSVNIEFYQKYPIIIIDSWSEFNSSYFTTDLYHKTWDKFNTTILNPQNFLN